MALAHLRVEDRCPPTALWQRTLVARRLTEHEIWTQLHAYELAESHGEAARGIEAANGIIERIAMVELAPPPVERALGEFRCPVRIF